MASILDLDRATIASIVTMLGGPWGAIALRRTCREMRDCIDAPKKVTPNAIMKHGARKGSRDICEFARQRGATKPDTYVLRAAARGGHIELCAIFSEWMHNKYIEHSRASLVYGAARNGNIALCEWALGIARAAHDTISWECALDQAARGGHRETCEWVIAQRRIELGEKGAHRWSGIMRIVHGALRRGNAEFIEYARNVARDAEYAELLLHDLISVAHCKNLSMIREIVEHRAGGVRIAESALICAAGKGRRDIADFAIDYLSRAKCVNCDTYVSALEASVRAWPRDDELCFKLINLAAQCCSGRGALIVDIAREAIMSSALEIFRALMLRFEFARNDIYEQLCVIAAESGSFAKYKFVFDVVSARVMKSGIDIVIAAANGGCPETFEHALEHRPVSDHGEIQHVLRSAVIGGSTEICARVFDIARKYHVHVYWDAILRDASRGGHLETFALASKWSWFTFDIDFDMVMKNAIGSHNPNMVRAVHELVQQRDEYITWVDRIYEYARDAREFPEVFDAIFECAGLTRKTWARIALHTTYPILAVIISKRFENFSPSKELESETESESESESSSDDEYDEA